MTQQDQEAAEPPAERRLPLGAVGVQDDGYSGIAACGHVSSLWERDVDVPALPLAVCVTPCDGQVCHCQCCGVFLATRWDGYDGYCAMCEA